jgi:hypothetical protein
MISHEHKIIFIHIPKCAGTSVEQRFGHLDGFTGRRAQDHRPMRMIEAPAPLPLALGAIDDAKIMMRRMIWPYRTNINPRNKLTVTPAQFKSYYKFAIVRDPWSRVYSWFRNVKNDDLHIKIHGISMDTSFDEFLDKFAGKGMLAPTEWWLRCFDGSIRLDRVIHFDDIEAGFAAVLQDLGLPAAPLEKHNVGSGSAHGAPYSPRSLDLIARVYGAEIKRFGFTPPATG